jgi:hypothetical protein
MKKTGRSKFRAISSELVSKHRGDYIVTYNRETAISHASHGRTIYMFWNEKIAAQGYAVRRNKADDRPYLAKTKSKRK